LLDQIGQPADHQRATDGLTGLSSLLQQALATVQQAQQASPTAAASTTGTVVLTTNTLGANNLLITTGARLYRFDRGERSSDHHRSRYQRHDRAWQHWRSDATDDGSGHLVLVANSPPPPLRRRRGNRRRSFGQHRSFRQSTTRATLQTNYNGLLSQINQLAGDATYNGVNLLTVTI